MAPLPNARHEAFARALVEGRSINESYEAAGYSKNRGNASRLNANESIQARVAELQTAAARASEVTVQSLLGELETARERADSAEQYSAAVRAIEAKARVSGLLVQKIEVKDISEDFDNAETPEQVAAILAKGMTEGRQLTAEDREGLASLLLKLLEDVSQYIAGCTAKPVTNHNAFAQENLERRRLNMRRRITNGGSANMTSEQ
jgi:phage terminase small subunit